MDHDDDGETSYNTFVDDVAFEPTYSQALLTAAGRNVATGFLLMINSNLVSTLCFVEIRRLKDRKSPIPHSHVTPSLWVNPFEFLTEPLIRSSRVVELSES